MTTRQPSTQFGAVDTVIAPLQARFGDRVSVVQAVRDQHARGEGLATSMSPDVVVWPLDKHEVCAILALCNERRVPVIAFGAGSSLEGHVSAPFGGVCIDMSRMDAILAVNAEDTDCVVQPGITREALNAHLKGTGLFFPVDPGANATIGGMVSTRASGTTTLRYGSMAHNVHVPGSGAGRRPPGESRHAARASPRPATTWCTCSPAPKARSASSPKSRCACTRCRPKWPRPAAPSPRWKRPSMRSPNCRCRACPSRASNSSTNTRSAPATCTPTSACPRCRPCSSNSTARRWRSRNRPNWREEVAASHGGTGFAWATRPEDRSRLWHARHLAYFAALALRPGCVSVVADICVPMSALAQSVAEARAMIDQEGLVAPILGHVGDGNFHVLFMPMPDQPEEHAAVDRVYAAMVDRALAVGGTCTGEHGIGMGKKSKLLLEYGGEVVGLMRSIKQAWDPNSILNPGKIF
jgi:D-lactate dehydrogenase (cytochrome)